MTLLLALLAQIGPFVSSQQSVPAPFRPPAVNPRKQNRQQTAAPAVLVPGRQASCLTRAETEPEAAAGDARDWLAGAQGADVSAAAHCLGVAQLRLARWTEAEVSLRRAHDAASESDHGLRARLGALAGYAALEGKQADRALSLLDPAVGDADMAGDSRMAGEIELDRSRALVALKRLPEAQAALARARGALPNEPEVWLLSATLSRRTGNLREAQLQIEEAARLAPTDGPTGVEAGVIAALAGHDQSARLSWQSVIAVAPGTEAARIAQDYLDQIGPAPGARP